MADTWHKVGKVTVTKGSNIVTGTNTVWLDNKQGITIGDIFIVPGAGSVQLYELKEIISNTEMHLMSPYQGDNIVEGDYALIPHETESVPDFAKRIAAALRYYQDALVSIYNFAANEGDVEFISPEGDIITVPSLHAMEKQITDAIENIAAEVNDKWSDTNVPEHGKIPWAADKNEKRQQNFDTNVVLIGNDNHDSKYASIILRTMHPDVDVTKGTTFIEKVGDAGLNIITRNTDTGANNGLITIPSGENGIVYHTGRPPTALETSATSMEPGLVLSTGAGDWTTAQFIAWLQGLGAFTKRTLTVKCGWEYASNRNITDTGLGNIQLAGVVIEFVGRGASECTITLTCPRYSAGGTIGAGAVLIYDSHGSSGGFWRKVYTSLNMPTANEIGALSNENPVVKEGFLALEQPGTDTQKGRVGAGSGDVFLNNIVSAKFLQLKDNGTLTYNDKLVYTGDQKPSANEINAGDIRAGGRITTIDTSKLPTNTFYPIEFLKGIGGSQHDFIETIMVKSQSRGGGDPYNQCQLYGEISCGSWSDTPKWAELVHHYYDPKERTIGGVYITNNITNSFIIYVRGGNVYDVTSASTATLKTTPIIYDNGNAAQKVTYPLITTNNAPNITNTSLVLDCTSVGVGKYQWGLTKNVSSQLHLDSKVSNSPTLTLGDDDTGFGYRSDGAMNIYANGTNWGTFEGSTFKYPEIYGIYPNSFRMYHATRSAFWRNDGSQLYLLKTNTNDPNGSYDNARPLYWDMVNNVLNLNPTWLNMHSGVRHYGTVYFPSASGSQMEFNQRMWGTGTRLSVSEWGWGAGGGQAANWGMYLQRETGLASGNQSRLNVNGLINGTLEGTSDPRLKGDKQVIDPVQALDSIQRLTGYTFQWKTTGLYSNGVMADDLLDVMPEAVSIRGASSEEALAAGIEEGDDIYTVEYQQLHALQIQAIKQLKDEVDDRDQKIAAQNQVIDNLQAQLYDLQQKIGDLITNNNLIG